MLVLLISVALIFRVDKKVGYLLMLVYLQLV